LLEKVFIAGGAGFIGSHFVERLLSEQNVKQVTVFDNFSSGQSWHLEKFSDKRLTTVQGEIKNQDQLEEAMAGHDTVIHLASNPDIARAAREPMIDFDAGTLLTQTIIEAMRRTATQQILYASGSGIYGDTGLTEVSESYGPLTPASTYGASKLAGEAMISAYSHMFGLKGIAFRFGNVVGPRQTHGVGYDFIQKLKADPTSLEILGDGSQSKSYVHISDVIEAVLLAASKVKEPFDAFNVATGDYITVKEIAQIVIDKVVGKSAAVKLIFSGGDRGWKGDVPIVRLNTDKIKALGWRCRHTCRQSIERSIDEMLGENKLFAKPNL